MKREIPPIRAAIASSDTPSIRIQSLRVMSGFPTEVPGAPAVLPPARLAEALAVMIAEVVELLPVADRHAALERVANRLDGFGRTKRGSEAAGLLRAVAAALMRMEG